MKHRAKPEDLSPFERFREFARRIIAVPKAEIDQQEAEYQRERAKIKGKGSPKKVFAPHQPND